MRTPSLLATGCLLLLGLAPPVPAAPDDLAPLLSQIKGVGREGAGNEDAARAWQQLTRRGPEVLPAVLAALDENDPTSANWLRTAVDAIAERARAQGRPLPMKELEKVVRDTRHAPSARRLAYEWLARADETVPGRLLPGMLRDPSVELRRDAIAAQMDQAAQHLSDGDKEAATAGYRKALSGAVDEDQVRELKKQLEGLGEKVDIAEHLGFIPSWYVATPFDNTNLKGFDVAYPPEKEVSLSARYKGKEGQEVGWKLHTTDDAFGQLDLNKKVGQFKGAVAYAYAVVESPEERPVEVRVGSINAVKIFLNGKEVFGREEYHHGMRVDQHIAVGKLNKGKNEILLKVLQNEQTEDWAQRWVFQARLCDASGSAVPFTLAPAMKADTPRKEKGE